MHRLSTRRRRLLAAALLTLTACAGLIAVAFATRGNGLRNQKRPALTGVARGGSVLAGDPSSGGAGAGTDGSPPALGAASMPLISRAKPAFTNDDCGGSHPARDANDGDFTTRWATCESPVSSGTPKWLAYDLSGVPATRRQEVVVAWFNDPMTSEYDHAVTGGPGYNNPGAFSIQVNGAGGGTGPPATGWTTLRSVPANTLHSRQFRLDMGGANWIRLLATASDGSPENEGVAVDLDVLDASGGVADDWMFYGDSITQDGMHHDARTARSGTKVRSFSDEVHALAPGRYPLFENGGIGGLRSADGAAHIAEWLALFPGRFVTLDYGTNDANATPGDTEAARRYHDNMAAMVDKVVAAGKTPIIPTIPWGDTPALRANVPALNRVIERLRTEHPRIVAGPDLYGLFERDPSLLGPDGVHPSWDQGYAALRLAWAKFAAGLAGA